MTVVFLILIVPCAIFTAGGVHSEEEEVILGNHGESLQWRNL